jgi:hypothetical protein
MTWLYLLKHKDEVFSVFKSFHIMVQTQFSAKIQVLRSNNGGEYVNQQFQTYFQNHGLLHETSCAQTPQQNGLAERKNRHILETARALLIGAYVPSRYWTDAVATTVHLLNRMPAKVLTFHTPLKVLFDHVPLPTVLLLPPRIFGCVAFVHSIRIRDLSWILVQFDAYSWGMEYIRKDIATMIPPPTALILPWMSHS